MDASYISNLFFIRRPLIPNGCRRAPWHDYRSRCIYLITINAAPGVPAFSTFSGTPGSHDFPPRSLNSPVGEIIATQLSNLKKKFPFTKILRRVIMPEHIHFILFVEDATEIHLGEIMAHFKGECSRVYNEALETAGVAGETPFVSLFEKGYHDRILMKKDQLPKMLAYVSDNPRRRMERMQNPECFQKGEVRDSEGHNYPAYGNIDLLIDPDIEAVRISRSFSNDELHRRKINWKRTVENCGVLVSPFISEGEKRVMEWAVENGGRIILICEQGFASCYTPKGRLHELCSEGRLLQIGLRPYQPGKRALTRALCMEMNALAEAIAAGRVRPR